MTTRIVVVAADAPVASAVAWASLHAAEHVVVVDEQERTVLGVASTRDLTRADPDDRVLACIATPAPCVDPEVGSTQAAALMQEWSVTALPVASEGQLLGVITADAVNDVTYRPADGGTSCLNCASDDDVALDQQLGISLCPSCRALMRWRSGGASG